MTKQTSEGRTRVDERLRATKITCSKKSTSKDFDK